MTKRIVSFFVNYRLRNLCRAVARLCFPLGRFGVLYQGSDLRVHRENSRSRGVCKSERPAQPPGNRSARSQQASLREKPDPQPLSCYPRRHLCVCLQLSAALDRKNSGQGRTNHAAKRATVAGSVIQKVCLSFLNDSVTWQRSQFRPNPPR